MRICRCAGNVRGLRGVGIRMQKRFIPQGRPLVMVLLMAVLEGCSMPGPKVDIDSLDSVQRFAYTVTIDDRPVLVSALRTGDPTQPRLIFVHGTPGDAKGWADELATPLSGPNGPYEIIALDRPGFGESDHKPMPSLAQQAAAIEPLLVKRDGRWPILVGHSLGGPIVARVAGDYPDRVGGLVIVAGALDPAQEHVLLIQRFGDLCFVRWALPRWARNSNSELIPLKGELESLEPLLGTIHCPVMIVHGDADTLVPFANVAYMEQAFSGSRDLVKFIIPKGTHFIPWNARETVDRAIWRAIEDSWDEHKPGGDTASEAQEIRALRSTQPQPQTQTQPQSQTQHLVPVLQGP